MNKSLILLLTMTLSVWADEPALKVSVLENDILCLHASRVPDNFAAQLQAGQPTNPIIGTILDLRFADGDQTVSAGNLFGSQKTPLVILMNSQTRGGAAGLVAQLQSGGRGIVIGNSNGKIRPDITIATSAEAEKAYQENPFVQLPAGLSAMATSNNLTHLIDHTSEADLVRKRIKDGEEDDTETARTEPATPVIRDPALARAVDLLKALTILKPVHH